MSVALFTQHAKRMRHIRFMSVASLTVPYFSTLSHKGRDFRKKSIENKKCVLIFSTTQSEKFLIPRRTERDIIITVRRSLCQIPFMCFFRY